jgi:hypothetical protein
MRVAVTAANRIVDRETRLGTRLAAPFAATLRVRQMAIVCTFTVRVRLAGRGRFALIRGRRREQRDRAQHVAQHTTLCALWSSRVVVASQCFIAHQILPYSCGMRAR